jgi:hypothetical protein
MVLLDLTQVLSIDEMTSLGQSLTGVAATQEQEYEH